MGISSVNVILKRSTLQSVLYEEIICLKLLDVKD
jgi:hypothetical protein